MCFSFSLEWIHEGIRFRSHANVNLREILSRLYAREQSRQISLHGNDSILNARLLTLYKQCFITDHKTIASSCFLFFFSSLSFLSQCIQIWKILISPMCKMRRAYTKHPFYATLLHKMIIEKKEPQSQEWVIYILCTSTTLWSWLPPSNTWNFENSRDALNRYVTISDGWDVLCEYMSIHTFSQAQVESLGIILLLFRKGIH